MREPFEKPVAKLPITPNGACLYNSMIRMVRDISKAGIGLTVSRIGIRARENSTDTRMKSSKLSGLAILIRRGPLAMHPTAMTMYMERICPLSWLPACSFSQLSTTM